MSIVFVSAITYGISPYYTNGDQIYYSRFYDEVEGKSFLEVLQFSKLIIDSLEPVYPFLVWIASEFFDKNLFLSISNATLVVGFFFACKKYSVPSFLPFFILTTNFYFYVLYFSAERLKFAFIFLFFAIIFSERVVRFLLLFIIAIFSHVQLILMFSGIVLKKLKPNFSNPANTFKTLFFYILCLGIAIYLKDHILGKVSYYANLPLEYGDILKILLFAAASFYYSNKNKTTLWLFFPLFLATFIFGGGRVVVMGFFIFLFYALQYKKGLNLGILFFSSYFLIKTLDFIENVIMYGDGFYVG